ncbi:hypothetical protein SAMN05421805_12252 [Saccharopolyspora antimicrobica]|uniref:Uncharacterized protein n=1 Tax=Saccharopolyspora antimicrobica TaxID=455193 RepID=A0A1I5JEC9_9PSEU|nr:hypothetical protein ATL45_0727 [Saccharopolyspora antimicrobica]SFO70711.1 hypothetical protein SAMN05421805_12252 [Saccharopolyspora antimicrobica]
MKGIRARWSARLAARRARRKPVISADDPALRVVVTAYDETEAASTALARADEWQSGLPAVLRHHLALPERSIESARGLLSADGWDLRPGGRGAERGGPGLTAMIALRVQELDALHCSQESSRMAGLAQRHGGQVYGWDALQPGPDAPS